MHGLKTLSYRQTYEDRYVTPDLDFFSCAYCGDTPNCFDHVPPLAAVRDFPRAKFPYYWLVPSCTDCNLTLAANYLFTFEERKAFVLERKHPRKMGAV